MSTYASSVVCSLDENEHRGGGSQARFQVRIDMLSEAWLQLHRCKAPSAPRRTGADPDRDKLTN